MKLTKPEAVAKSKNGLVDIGAFGAELRVAHDASLTTRDEQWEITGATARQVDAMLSAHEGDPLPEEKPVQWIDRGGELIANVGGKEIKFSDAVKAIR